MTLPSTTARLITLPDKRAQRYRNMETSLATTRKNLALLGFGVSGACSAMLDPTITRKQYNTLAKYIASWQKQTAKLERKALQLLAGMNVIQPKGSLL